MSQKRDSLEKISEEIEACKKCELSKNRTHSVPGEGNRKAEIFFVGEGPGKSEDLEGRPFVGAAGKFLDEMIESIDLERGDVFIGNVIKCRPPNNRDPNPEEVELCKEYLYRQIKVIKPKIICTLGRFSLGLFLPGHSISKIHGKPKRLVFETGDHPLQELGSVVVLPLYHPAVALYRGNMRRLLKDDFKIIPKILKKLKTKTTN